MVPQLSSENRETTPAILFQREFPGKIKYRTGIELR
jgi:hypothetical protein